MPMQLHLIMPRPTASLVRECEVHLKAALLPMSSLWCTRFLSLCVVSQFHRTDESGPPTKSHSAESVGIGQNSRPTITTIQDIPLSVLNIPHWEFYK